MIDKKNNVKLFWSSNKKTKYSASAGAFYCIAEDFLNSFKKDSVVYGCAIIDGKAVHIGICDKNDLYKLQGSKYVQSNILQVFDELKLFLEKGKKVLFSGTACQVAAIKSYLRKDYKNLYTIDIVCHGVPSPELFESYQDWLKKKYKSDTIKDIRFRNKSATNRNGYILKLKTDDKKRRIFAAKDPYYSAFLEGYSLRPSCYECKYSNENRVSDISIGDSIDAKFHPTQGISLVIINSEKGKDIFNKIQYKNDIVKSTYEKESAHNLQLKKSTKLPDKRYIFYKELKEKGWDFEVPYISIISNVKIYLKNIIPTYFKVNIKKLIK